MLMRVSNTNGKFRELLDSWSAECNEYGEDLNDYAAPAIQHAQKIAAEHPEDPEYGIYVSASQDGFDFLAHINRAALPRTTGKTLRVLWVLLAPRFDFIDVKAETLAKVSTSLIIGSLCLAKSDLPSEHIKIHLGNFADHKYFTAIAAALKAGRMFQEQAVRGNWMHITM